MELYKNFIDENRVYFEARVSEATKKGFRTLGFPIYSADESFNIVINKKDVYYLPYCLLLIYLGIGVSRDKTFTKMAFTRLLPNEEAYSDMPTLAYIYAYCENRDGNIALSETILEYLTKQYYPPALASFGDMMLVKKDQKLSRQYYLESANLGHIVAKTRYIRLFKKGTNFFLRLSMHLNVTIKIFLGKAHGEKFLFLDFYKIQK